MTKKGSKGRSRSGRPTPKTVLKDLCAMNNNVTIREKKLLSKVYELQKKKCI